METWQFGATLVFSGAGFMTTFALIKTVQDQLDAIAELLNAYAAMKDKNGFNDYLVSFETVTCGGCGDSVPTGEDGFTPIEHDCFIAVGDKIFRHNL